MSTPPFETKVTQNHPEQEIAPAYHIYKSDELFDLETSRKETIQNNLTTTDVVEYLDASYRGVEYPARLVHTIGTKTRVANSKFDESLEKTLRGTVPEETSDRFFDAFQLAMRRRYVNSSSISKTSIVNDLKTGIDVWSERDPDFLNTFSSFIVDYYKYLRDRNQGHVTVGTVDAVMSELLFESKKKIIPEQIAKTVRQIGRKAFEKSVETHNVLSGPEGRQERYNGYVLGPGILKKDTTVLMEASEKLEDEPASKVFGYKNKSDVILRSGLDLVERILKEASNNGWSNATILANELQKMPRRSLPPHSVVIHLANAVTDSLNKSGVLGDVRLEKMRPVDIENTSEAIDRCMYVIFELGKRPKDLDSINFLVSADIASKFFIEAQSNIQKEEQDFSVDSRDAQSERYHKVLQEGRGKHTYWHRWKSGHGLFS